MNIDRKLKIWMENKVFLY